RHVAPTRTPEGEDRGPFRAAARLPTHWRAGVRGAALADRRHAARGMGGEMTRVAKLRWISLGSVLALIAVWSVVTWLDLARPDALPSPHKLFQAFVAMIGEGYGGSPLLKHVGMSVMRALSGFVAAVVLGVPFGILIGRHPVLSAAVAPIIGFFRPIPPIAFLTLFVFYFGIGEASKIGLIFMAA